MLNVRYKNDSIIKLIGDIPHGVTCLVNGIEKIIHGNILHVQSLDGSDVDVIFTDYVPNIDFRRSNVIAVYDAVLPMETIVYMFEGCGSLKTLCANVFSNNREHTNLTGIFKDCTSLDINRNLGMFNLITKVNSLNHAFENTKIELLHKDTLSADCFLHLKTAANSFSNCRMLRHINSDALCKLKNLVFIDGMFRGCSSLRSVPIGTFNGLDMLKSATALFRDSNSMKVVNKNIGCEFPSFCNVTGMFRGTGIVINRK